MIAERHSRGNSLIEVLVSMVILAVGLLGVAAIQVYSLRMVGDAEVRSIASILASDMAERMRANAVQWPSYQLSSQDCVDAIPPDGVTNIAVMDVRDWCRRIRRELPGASGQIDVSQGVAVIQVEWEERATGDQASAVRQRYTLRVRLGDA